MADQENGAPLSPPPPSPPSPASPSPLAAGTDLISLEESQHAPLERGPGASSQDTILNAAEIFQSQLEQMTAWKHQLAQQMELMRRDGIKLLERQKALAIEKKHAGEDREALAAEREKIQRLQHDVDGESQRLKQRAADIEQAQAQLQKLHADKDRWESELAEAKQEAESLATQKSLTATELAAAEVRLAEVRAIEARRDELKQQVTDAEQRLVQIEADRRALETARHDLELQQAELQARQKALAEQEARCLAEDVRLKEGLEQLEALRRTLSETQRQATHDREAVTAQQHQLTGREQALAQQQQELGSREEAVRAGRSEIDQTHLQLQARQAELAQREQAAANSAREAEAELKSRLTQADQFRQQAGEERQAALTLRGELQRKLDALDQEHAEQHEALAKQTKRLQERRNEIEAAERNLDKALEERIAKATQAMQDELAGARQGYEQRAAQLEQRAAQSESAAQAVRASEENLRRELGNVQNQLNAVREDLTAAGAAAVRLKEENAALTSDLAAHVEEAKRAADQWQAQLDAVKSQGASGEQALQQANESAAEARKDIEKLKGKILELKTARDNVEFQLELQAEDGRKALEAARQEMTQELARRDQEIAGWKTKYELAMKSAPGKGETLKGKAAELAKQLIMLEQQRNDLAEQLFSVQDSLKRHQAETQTAKNTWQAELAAQQQKTEALEAEKAKWKTQRVKAAPATGAPDSEEARQQAARHRERLLRQARGVRSFRQQLVEYKAAAEVGRLEIAQQREQLRSRKENLEQVKRLLEKQEMVMARKLADHNAIKTVAALGIFVIMILGSSFFGVYRFVHPVYRSEAVVRLAPDEHLQGAELQTWIKSQADFLHTNEVTFAAWKILRSAEEHYGMQDVREEWLGSLTKNMTVQTDATSKTLAIRYTGPDAEGVSQVCNAMATAYASPGIREITDETRNIGQGAQVLAKATVPLYPVEDSRLMISLYVVAGVLVVSFFLVLLFRHFVARQLREIDQMADAQDLDDVGGDPAAPAPQPAA